MLDYSEFPVAVDAAEVKAAFDAFLTRIGSAPSPEGTEFADIKISGLTKQRRLSVEVTYSPAVPFNAFEFRGPQCDNTLRNGGSFGLPHPPG